MGGAIAVPSRDAGSAFGRPPVFAPAEFERQGAALGTLRVFGPDLSGGLPLDAAEPPRMGVVLALEPVLVEQLGRSVSLAAGEWTLYRPDRLARVSPGGRALVVLCPRSALPDCLGCALLDRFDGDEPVNRVTFSVLSALAADACRLAPGCGSELAHAALHVLRNAVLDRCGRRRAARDPLLQRVKEALEWRLRDPELSVGALADALSCTERSIHRAFKSEGETFSRYVLRRRLERCRADLASPRLAHQSVTEIALSHGFNSPAHFSRTFKEHFGCSPSAGRASVHRAAAGR